MELKLDRRELATVKAALARRTGGGNALVVGDDLPQAASIL
jgi:hypothetical protein